MNSTTPDKIKTVDAATQAFLDQIKASGAPPIYESPVNEARKFLKAMVAMAEMAPTPVTAREGRAIPGPNGDIPVRIYWPRCPSAGETLPLLLLYHGGGFVLGDLDTNENLSRYYCAHGDVIVINVDYRLAPEHKFPVGVEDCYAALSWASAHAHELGADPARIAVTGESAGGNLSAVMCQLAKTRGGPRIAYQILVSPALNMNTDADLYESRRLFGSGEYFVGQKDVEWLCPFYFHTAEDARDPRASPILAADLKGLPPALVVTAGYEILRDEGRLYADRLRQAGVDVEYKCFETTIHGFLSNGGIIPAGREAAALIVDRLKRRLAGPQ